MCRVFLLVCFLVVILIGPLNAVGIGGEPLLLTPYIENGLENEARKVSRNAPLIGDVESYSGFFTVNKTTDTNVFFWFFPAEGYLQNAPVTIWLQGGPGCASTYGALFENGPYDLQHDLSLKRRAHYWSRNLNVLYIDNPAGTGFSYSGKGDYAKNEEEIGNYLRITLKQFLSVFSELKENPVYVAGESYGGKYVPALAYAIHINNKIESTQINLRGISIGNGLIDPVNMMVHGRHLYQLGLIDDTQLTKYDTISAKIIENINSNEWSKASDGFNDLFSDSDEPNSNFLFNSTGFKFHYNILESQDDGTLTLLARFMDLPKIRRALHVGNVTFSDGTIAAKNLHDDAMKSILPKFIELVENYNVLLYNGQLDIIIPYPTTINFVKKMNWSGAQQYKNAQRKIFRAGNDIAGYTKSVYHSKIGEKLHFTEMLVRNAGHMVPRDQPYWALEMIERFTHLENPF